MYIIQTINKNKYFVSEYETTDKIFKGKMKSKSGRTGTLELPISSVESIQEWEDQADTRPREK